MRPRHCALHRPRRRITAGLGVPLPCPPPRRWLQVNHGVGGDGVGGWRELDRETWPRWEVPMGRGGPGARWSRGAASSASVSPGDAGSRWARFGGAGSGQAGCALQPGGAAGAAAAAGAPEGRKGTPFPCLSFPWGGCPPPRCLRGCLGMEGEGWLGGAPPGGRIRPHRGRPGHRKHPPPVFKPLPVVRRASGVRTCVWAGARTYLKAPPGDPAGRGRGLLGESQGRAGVGLCWESEPRSGGMGLGEWGQPSCSIPPAGCSDVGDLLRRRIMPPQPAGDVEVPSAIWALPWPD